MSPSSARSPRATDRVAARPSPISAPLSAPLDTVADTSAPGVQPSTTVLTTTSVPPTSTTNAPSTSTTSLAPTTSTTAAPATTLADVPVPVPPPVVVVPVAPPWTVTSVTDGDTIEVAGPDGELTVRLIGINTPESNECWADEATAALSALVAGQPVTLVRDSSDTDQYGRVAAVRRDRRRRRRRGRARRVRPCDLAPLRARHGAQRSLRHAAGAGE